MTIWRRLKYLLPFYRRAEEREIQEELESLAEIAGRRELGNLTLAAENARAAWGWGWLEGVLGDLRYALRILARRPSFSVVAVVSLGLAIGANAAIFSLIDTLLLRVLPVHEPERLVSFQGGYSFSYFRFERFGANSQHVLTGILATTGAEARDLDAGGEPKRGYAELVSGNYFELLGVPARLGRMILAEDDRRGAPALVAVISYGYWQRAYGASPSVLGQTLRVHKVPFTIVGVAPSEFFGVTIGKTADVWLPLSTLAQVFPGRTWLDKPNTNFLTLLARLRPGVTPEQASAALTPLSVQIDLERAGPGLPEWIRKNIEKSKLTLKPAANGISFLRMRFSRPLQVVFAMVAIGLLLVCVNILSLQFARTDERRWELSVRLAIGGGRTRIVRQLLTEALVVALFGAVVGLVICRPAAAALTSVISQGGDPVQLDLRIDSTMLLFILGLSTLAALVCGIAPALRAARGDPARALQQKSRATSAVPFPKTLGRAVASLQFALSVGLIAAAFLFAFSLYKLTHFDTGLDRRHLVMVDVDATEAGYRGDELSRLNVRIVERLSGVPGVESVSFSENGIYSGRNSNTQMGADGFQAPNGPERNAFYDQMGPRYFTTIGARIVAGRDFDESDNAAGAKVAIVNEEFARHFFSGKNPVGSNIYDMFGKERKVYQVIGVVRSIRTDVRRAPLRYFYLPHQRALISTRFLLRTELNPSAVFGDVRSAIRLDDPRLRITSIDSADRLLDRTLDLDRLIAALSFGFGILALVLAAVGIYGLLAYQVTQRKGEIGIRMALGASKPSVMRLVLREVAIVAGVGIAAGTAAALGTGRLLEALVFEVKPLDPRVLASAALVLAATALCAAWLPVRRAAQMDPMAALRNE